MAKVDAVSTPGGEALADKFNVTGYPTLIWFVNGKPKPYTQNPGNAQDRSDIVFWVVSQTDVNTRALTQQVINHNQLDSPHKFESAMRKLQPSQCLSEEDLTLAPALRTSIKLSTATSLF